MLSKEEIDRVEKLAELNLSEQQKDDLRQDLTEILDYFEKLDELNTEDVQPLRHILDLENVLREDKLGTPLDRGTALKNAPQTHNGFFEVPKVVNKEKRTDTS